MPLFTERLLVVALIVVVSLSFASATTTTLSTSQESFTLNPGDSNSVTVSYSISNANGLAGAKGVVITGTPRFLAYSGGAISFVENTTTTGAIDVQLNVPSTITEGEYVNYITIDEQVLDITLIVEAAQVTGCRLIELPHTTNFRIKQGETGGSNQIRIKVSNECTSSLSMSVNEQTQMSKPMFLQGQSGDLEPGEEFSFSVGLDAIGVQTGTYSNTYIVSGTEGDNVYEKRINLLTIVTLGDSPVDEDSFSTLPSCNIDSDMQLNQTYSLICNNENLNINIEVPHNPYFQGISVTESEGRFEYNLKPTQIGNTEFIALFKYKDVPIGEPFSKNIRITRGSLPIEGTQMDIVLYQEGVKKAYNQLLTGNTDFLVRDNNTLGIITNFYAYLNGKLLDDENFTLEIGKEYEMIVSSPGYETRTLNLTVGSTYINITVTPKTGNSGTQFTITTDVNATIYINDVDQGNYYVGTLPVGHVVIRAVRDGYLSTENNMTIDSQITFFTSGELKKGTAQVVTLNKNASWQVYYQKNLDSNMEIFLEGSGAQFEFTPSKAGRYILKSGEAQKVLELEGFDWKFKIWKFAWYYWLAGLIIIVAIFVARSNGNLGNLFGKKQKSTIGFGASVPNYGGGN